MNLFKILLILSMSIEINAAQEGLSFQRVILNNFTATYKKGIGQAKLSKAFIGASGLQVNLNAGNLDFRKVKNTWRFYNQTGSFAFTAKRGGILSSMTYLNVDSVNFNLLAKRNLSLTSRNLEIEIGNGIQRLRSFSLQCSKNKGAFEDYVLPCLTNTNFRTPLIVLSELSTKTVNKALAFNKINALFGNNKASEINKVTNVNLTIRNGKLQLGMNVFKGITVRVRINAQINYVKGRYVSLVINSAKAGWFNIKNDLINGIRDAKLKGVSVSGSKIIFKI